MTQPMYASKEPYGGYGNLIGFGFDSGSEHEDITGPVCRFSPLVCLFVFWR
ncbi:hypothetical protein HanRHA438_Chr04g0154841 [Helianthus annuus]|nr:hypothetical protein HanRHA438_Chr04g0154841 [Helianthus annuus]